MSKLETFNSVEYDIVKEIFQHFNIDKYVAGIVENYIYQNVKKRGDFNSKICYRTRFGKRDGEYKEWWDNGKLYEKKNYQNGKLEGEYNCWYRDGQLEIQKFYKNGKREGESKEWWRNGQLAVQEFYINNKLKGECKQWCQNGNLIY